MVALSVFEWKSVLTAEIFDKTFAARVQNLLSVVETQNANDLEVEFLEALSATTHLHTIFASTQAMPGHYKKMKSLHQFINLSSIEARDRGAGHGKNFVEAHHAALTCLKDDCGSCLKEVLGEEKFKVVTDLIETKTKSDAMDAARKEALQGCGLVFEAAAKTFSFLFCVYVCLDI